MKLYSNQKKLENDIEEEMLTLLNKNHGVFWKADYAGRLVQGKMLRAVSKFVRAGMPDIQGVIKGQFVFFEVKTPTALNRIKNNYEKYKLYKGDDKTILRYQRQIITCDELAQEGGLGGFVSQYSHCVDFINGKYSGRLPD